MPIAPARLSCWSIAVAVSALATGAVHAEAEQYRLDPVHTRVLLAVGHAGFSKALGTVSGSSGLLVFDPQDVSTARLQASVPLQRLDFGDAEWNRAVLARNLLDAQRHPQAEFVSTRIEPLEQGRFAVIGDLTLHGVTRPVRLEVAFNQLKRHPLPPFRRTAGFSATATLSRAEFGIDAWRSVIDDEVQLRIEAEAVRDGGGAPAVPEDAPAQPPDAADAPVDAAPAEAPP